MLIVNDFLFFKRFLKDLYTMSIADFW